MNKPSQGQVLNALAILMNNADWDSVDSSVLQTVIDSPQESGQQFTAFLKNGGRVVVGEPKIVSIDRSAAFGPVAFIGAGWSVVEQDERSLTLTEIDPTKVQFKVTLKNSESSVVGEEKLKRLIASGEIRLDAKILQTLWENQYLIPESWKQLTNGNTTFIYFDGTVLQDSSGDRYVLCLYWNAGRWHWYYLWLGYEWHANHPSAVLAS